MRFSFLLLCVLPFSMMAQDILIKRNGQEIKTRIIKIERKEITYKVIDDPEFQTQTVSKKEVRMIRMEEGKVYDYDRVYAAPYIGIGGGLWAPVGRFGSYESNEETTPGYAMKGQQLKIGAGFYFSRKLGVALEARFLSSKFNDDEFDESRESTLYSSQETDGNRYGASYFFIGPMYSSLLGNKFTLDIKALGGGLLLNARTQHTKYFVDNGQQPVSEGAALDDRTDFSNAFTLGGGLGINLRYSIAKKFSVSLHCDYIHASPKVDFVNMITDNTSFAVEHPDINSSIVRSISGINLGLSINYEFNRRKDW